MLASHPLKLAGIAKVSNRKVSDVKQLKILTPKQVITESFEMKRNKWKQKPMKTSENLLNEITQIMYFLYEAKETTKKCKII